MPGCVLHVIGEAFDPAPVLASLSLRPYAVFCKGDKLLPGKSHSKKINKKVHSVGGFKCDVSSMDDLAKQVKDAIAFLLKHYDALRQLASIPAIGDRCLDFGYACRLGPDGEGCCAQFDRLPHELLKLCGELAIDIELSLYATQN